MIGQSRSPTPWTKPLSSWIRVLGRSRTTPTPPPSTDHRVVPPSRFSPGRRRQRWSLVPAWPGCGTRGPSFRHHGSAVDRRDPAGDHRKGSRLERSPRSPGSGELYCRWQECFSRVQTVRSDPVWPCFPAIRKYQEGLGRLVKPVGRLIQTMSRQDVIPVRFNVKSV